MNIIVRRKIWFLISLLIIIPGIISLILWGMRWGLDFKGGTLLELEFSKKVDVNQIKDVLAPFNLKNLTIQSSGENKILIRTTAITKEEKDKIEDALNSKINKFNELRYETIGPVVSKDLTRKAIWAVILASVAIVFYIAFAFRKVPKPTNSWRFGICAILALIHDLLVVIGIFSILGHFFKIEIDSLFITALLTIMGFSVHDTIVVFDRIRENMRLRPEGDFEQIVNDSVVQTLDRSINTSLTVLIVLTALYLFGGETIKHFILALLVGIFIGTYSSIFTASPLLVVWQNWVQSRQTRRA